jgi:hypothetical protein
MASIAKHTDLSWEIPGPRAIADVPLEDIDLQVPGHGTRSGVGSEWRDAPDFGSWDDNAGWTGLEDFEQFWPGPYRFPNINGPATGSEPL